MIKLDIPYKSQLTNTSRNDCGAAVSAMLTGVSVDRILEIIEQPKDKALLFRDIERALASFGITAYHKRPIYIPQIKAELTLGHPMVILANYSVVRQPQTKFDGAHFFLAVGCDGEAVYVHDPLWNGDKGAYLRLDDGSLDYAMKQPGWGNQGYQCLVIERVYPLAAATAVDALPDLPPGTRVLIERLTAESKAQTARADKAAAVLNQIGELLRDYEA